MRIQESAVTLAATHEFQSSHRLEVNEVLSFRQVFEQQAVSANDANVARQRVEKLLQSLLDAILGAIDGKKCSNELAAVETLPTQKTNGDAERGFTWQRIVNESIYESEKTSVCGEGKIKTCDGREIAFNYALNLEREFQSLKTTNESGAVALRDPLILSFEGKSCELTDTSFCFDLYADGQMQKIPGLGASSAFLVFDRNGNGKADDGSELFGVTSGNGFADLGEFDSDQNGWIDEADPIWGQLALWSGDRFSSLASHGVGALCLTATEAPFALKSETNQLLGQIRSAGIYLTESGEVGQLQQVDLAVSADKD